MPELLVHFAVPFAALALAGLSRQKAFFVGVLALTPDLDILLLTHRSPTHSLALSTAAAIILYLLLRNTRYRPYAILAWLGVATHLTLDVFGGYTPLLWPAWDHSIRFMLNLDIHISSPPTFIFHPQILTRPTAFTPLKTIEGPLFTGEGLIMATILLLPVAYRILQDRLRDDSPHA